MTAAVVSSFFVPRMRPLGFSSVSPSNEERRRAERGEDVVVAFAECHGRPRTEAMLHGLETVPRARCTHHGARFEEVDLAAVLARRPQVAIVDEFAHSNVPGDGRHPKRWQDIEALLAAGVDVIAALNIQHLESLNDVAEKITHVPQHETVPDEVVRRAHQVELVDMPPEGLRRRMAHGNIHVPEKVDAALSRLTSERRSLGRPIDTYVREAAAEPGTRVTVLIPEAEPERLWQRLLQNQRGAVVAHAVRRETDAAICRLRFRLL